MRLWRNLARRDGLKIHWPRVMRVRIPPGAPLDNKSVEEGTNSDLNFNSLKQNFIKNVP